MVFCYSSPSRLRYHTLGRQLKIQKVQTLGTKRQEQKEKHITCLGLNLIVQELLLELGQSIVGAVVVQIQRVEDVPEEGETVPAAD